MIVYWHSHTCQLLENFMGEKARKRPFSTHFYAKLPPLKVVTISKGEILENFILFRAKIFKIKQKFGRSPENREIWPILTIQEERVGVPPKIGSLPIHGGELACIHSKK